MAGFAARSGRETGWFEPRCGGVGIVGAAEGGGSGRVTRVDEVRIVEGFGAGFTAERPRAEKGGGGAHVTRLDVVVTDPVGKAPYDVVHC